MKGLVRWLMGRRRLICRSSINLDPPSNSSFDYYTPFHIFGMIGRVYQQSSISACIDHRKSKRVSIQMNSLHPSRSLYLCRFSWKYMYVAPCHRPSSSNFDLYSLSYSASKRSHIYRSLNISVYNPQGISRIKFPQICNQPQDMTWLLCKILLPIHPLSRHILSCYILLRTASRVLRYFHSTSTLADTGLRIPRIILTLECNLWVKCEWVCFLDSLKFHWIDAWDSKYWNWWISKTVTTRWFSYF